MNKELLRNQWILALLLLGINLILGAIVLAVVSILKIGNSGVVAVAGLSSAMAVGQIYTSSFREIMPKKLRINVVAIYILAQVPFGILYAVVLEPQNFSLFVGILIAASLVSSVFVYFMIGSGGKAQLKAIQKKESARKQ